MPIYLRDRIRVCETCKCWFRNDKEADDHTYYTGHGCYAYYSIDYKPKEVIK